MASKSSTLRRKRIDAGLCMHCSSPRNKYAAECDSCRVKHREANKPKHLECRRKLKSEMIQAYGGKCVCCAVTQHEFLTIDHINGDGAEERRSGVSKGTYFYAHLKRQGWPKDRYRLLCWNCNCSFGQFGYCPHGADAGASINAQAIGLQ